MNVVRLRTLLIAIFVALPLAAFAQDAVISGTITDSTGGTLPGVTVTATNEATGNTFTAVTDERGAFRIPVRVIYVVNEPRKVGFAYGTLPGHPEDGEESWMVEQRDDGSVWITVRAFSRPANGWWWAVYPALRILQAYFTERYLRALAGPIS